MKLKNKLRIRLWLPLVLGICLFLIGKNQAQVTFVSEIKITDNALHFDGKKVGAGTVNVDDKYDYVFGPNISAHGDCIKFHEGFVFMSWWRGDQHDRHMMLSRLNIETGNIKTIEFPHRHTGHNNVWYLGESHNTIGVGISPLDGTIHLLFDMHAYNKNFPGGGAFAHDYFRYAYSIKGAASVQDEEFNLDLFVKDEDGDYNHLSLNEENHEKYERFTYPKFFLNSDGDLFMYMRKWSSSNGGYHFAKYEADQSTWTDFVKFSDFHASDWGQPYDWGIYGNMKYLNGKIRVGFQRRLNNKEDKYIYQNGFYYAYSDDQSGVGEWKNSVGQDISIPVRDADIVKISEPGDLVTTTAKDKVHIVGGFDWTVTGRGDVHFIGRVKDNENNVNKNVHTYRPVASNEFITTTDFVGGSRLYTAGNNVYIIGLNSSGRIYIEKSEGGKNEFERVYEATSGTQFRHGVAYVDQGVLYYYLMEKNATGQKRPLYLQIIDLGVSEMNTNTKDFTRSSQISIFPNPSNNLLNIQYDSPSHISYSIYSLSGVKLLRGKSANKQIDISALGPGVYFVHFQNNLLDERLKFVVP